MAFPNRVKPGFAVIEMGNGSSPEVFTILCGIRTQGITAQTNTTDDFLKDCVDPEAVPVRFVIPTGKQWDLSGSGVVNLDNLTNILNAQGVSKNFRYTLGVGTGQTGTEVVMAGPAMITNVQIGGSEDNFASLDISIASDGEWTYA